MKGNSSKTGVGNLFNHAGHILSKFHQMLLNENKIYLCMINSYNFINIKKNTDFRKTKIKKIYIYL